MRRRGEWWILGMGLEVETLHGASFCRLPGFFDIFFYQRIIKMRLYSSLWIMSYRFCIRHLWLMLGLNQDIALLFS